MNLRRLFLAMTLASVTGAGAAPLAGQARASRERAEQEYRVKAEKLEQHLLPLMREHGVDMWIIMSRENDPDPAMKLFGEYGIAGWWGHRNAYVFHDRGPGQPLERTVIGTHQSGFIRAFFPDIVPYGEEGLAPHLREYVQSRDPGVIAIDQSRTITMADGLSVEAKKYLVDAIGPTYAERLVSSEPLFIDYVSTRTPAELAIARQASWITWNILKRAFSNEVVTPGETTLMDVHWWIVDEWRAQDLEFNFPPGLSIQRRGVEGELPDVDDPVIRPGDLIHVDFGVDLMGIVTDQQKMIYVLRPDETEPPEGLRKAFEASNRVARIIAEELKPGVLGKDVKATADARARAEGIDADVYSHVQGNWVHDAGAWANPDWPDRYGHHPREPVRAGEFWSVEFGTHTPIPEWDGQAVFMGREEDAWVGEDGVVHFMTGPQEALWLIESPGQPVRSRPAG